MKNYARGSKPDASLNAGKIDELIENYHRSGMTQRKFASVHGIAYSTFTLWLSRSRKGPRKKSDAKWLEMTPGETRKETLPNGVKEVGGAG